jgi:hypothetical protein
MTKTSSYRHVPRSIWLATLAAPLGVVLLIVGVFLSVISFDHNNANPYSCWNHVISELGFPYASPLTCVFNATVVVSSLLFLPMLYQLGTFLRTRLGYMAIGCGFVTFLALSALGVLGLRQDFLHSPYVFLRFFKIHMAIAGVFFLGWLATVTMLTIAFCGHWKDPLSRLMAIVGMVSFLVFPTAVVVSLSKHPMETALQKDLRDPGRLIQLNSPTSSPTLSPWLDSHRPSFWGQAFMEWCLAWSGLLWFCTASAFLWKKAKEPHQRHSEL